MQQALNDFLKHIGFDSTLFHYLESNHIEKVVYDEDKDVMNVYMTTQQVMDIRIFSRLHECMLPYSDQFHLLINIANPSTINNIAVNAYYYYFLEHDFASSIIYENLRKLKLSIQDNSIVFHLSSNLLVGSLNEVRNQLETAFIEAGFSYPITYHIEELPLDHIEEEINYERVIASKEAKREKDNQIKVVDTNKYDKDFYRKREKDKVEIALKDLQNEDTNVTFTARIFLVDPYEIRSSGKKIYNIYLTDETDSVMMTLKESAKFSKDFIESLKENSYVRVHGDMEFNQFAKDFVFVPQSIEKIELDNERYDDEIEKRVELHLHTNMSTMDAVGTIEDYVATALKWGHRAIAVTDHGGIQNFPSAQKAVKGKNIKMIYGMEGYVIDDCYTIAYNESNVELENATYVALDIETTGLSSRHDEIIEFGAVKIKDGLIVDSFQTFVNPGVKLPQKIKELTKIDDGMLVDAPSIDMILPKIKKFLGDSILVAHNATFDIGFLNEALAKRQQSPLLNPYIDTMNLGKCLYTGMKSYALGAVSRTFNIAYDEDVAHRADYDAKVLGDVLNNMMDKIRTHSSIKTHADLNQLNGPDNYKTMRPYHMIFLVQNEIGLKNLYNLVSLSHIQFITSVPLIPRRYIDKFRDGLLIGSSCFNGEIFDIAMTKSKKELEDAMLYYDYIEIQPLENYSWLIDTGRVLNQEKLIEILNDIVDAAQSVGKMVVGTGDAHYVDIEDKTYRDVYIYAQSVGARRHPLYDYKHRVVNNPNQHFRTTTEMLESYPYLNRNFVKEIVIDNSNKIADLIGKIEPVKEQLFTPKLDGIDTLKEIQDMCHKNVTALYGDNPPKIVTERLERELKSIKDNDFSVIYYLAYRLVKNSRDEGYLVGSRGSVGSSFVATLCGITEVNPLKPHYLCPVCHYSDFSLPDSVKSGYDLEEVNCPKCGNLMHGEGQNIPFETFLGINGDKVPDIDLNFSREYQARAHNFTKVLLGEDNVFRAGTISTVADKTAFGYVRNYFEEIGKVSVRIAEIERLAKGCTDVKRTTGQHPGGIIVVPQDKDVHDFTPIQYPADESDASWKTTHYPYQAIHDEILKLDILGHVDPSALRMLYDLTGIDPEEIPMNDKKVISLFTETSALGAEPHQILNTNGTAGIPEFGTKLVKSIVDDAKPKCFSELVQISGISHGTNVWRGNAQDLIRNGTCSLMEVIGCRDDIMTYLVAKGMEHKLAFKIMESVRKGKGLSPEFEKAMVECDVPDWYITSCKKIEYMFPKAHATAYVCMALRVAWYKVYKPLEYYATFFTLRCDAYELETMIAGYDTIKKRFKDIRDRIQSRSSEVTNKEKSLYDVLQIALEMTARGIKFSNLSLTKSDARNFIVDYEKNEIIPPFSAIDGLGESVANSIIEAREKSPFISKQDLMNRSSINQTQIKIFEAMGVLSELQEENQLSLNLF